MQEWGKDSDQKAEQETKLSGEIFNPVESAHINVFL